MYNKSMKSYKTDFKAIFTKICGISRGKNKLKIIVVEGIDDKRFLSPYFDEEDNIEFIPAEGKEIVMQLYNKFKEKNFFDKDSYFFYVDLDYDLIHEKISLIKNDKFICNVYCFNDNQYFFNDLESFLVNTSALKKLLSSFDQPNSTKDVNDLKVKLELASRAIGKYRAADVIVIKEQGLQSSVLDGLKLDTYFDVEAFCILNKKLESEIPNWSRQKLSVEDLIVKANELNNTYSQQWALSRGHDITKLLELYLSYKTKKNNITQARIEEVLRVACEKIDFEKTPMYKKIANDIIKISDVSV